ncbi:hypothetical protein C7S16_1533 [Burkholderia thailandensis]|uniref:Uncharacterized protein n=1 Tax=Burkholderia thailandensis TaxID=57975 RepID=A0AAW9CS98_BURTH|nr:hypothetical protein [Burkholderia thailandensis]
MAPGGHGIVGLLRGDGDWTDNSAAAHSSSAGSRLQPRMA